MVEVYADGAVRESPWFADYGDVDVAVAVLRLSGGALAILSGTRHDPLGYDVRLEAFGTADSIAVGLDDAEPDPLGRARRSDGTRCGLPRLHRPLRAGLPRRARGVRRDRPQHGPDTLLARAGTRSAAASHWRPTARAQSGGPSRSRRSLAPQPPPAETATGNPTKETGMGIEDETHETTRGRAEGSPAAA